MTPELDNKLYTKYPKIFRQRNLPVTQTAMCWGFEHGPGWYTLIDILCHNIQHHIDSQRKYRAQVLLFNRALTRALNGDKSYLIRYHTYRGKVTDYTLESVERFIKEGTMRKVPDKVYQVEATQVKEKYGTLRFYTTGVSGYVDGLISMAESMSAVTCEECGNPGKLRGGYWVYTACDEHTKPNDLSED
jgi:hypothetical protein